MRIHEIMTEQWMRTDEGGALNAKETVYLHFINSRGNPDFEDLFSAIDEIKTVGEREEWPQEVRTWFQTIFFNWLKRSEHLAGRRSLYRMNIKDYLEFRGHTGKRAEALIDQLPEYARDGDMLLPIGLTGAIEDYEELQGVVDFLIAMVANGRRISRMSVDEAFAMSERWHKEKAAGSRKSVEGIDVKTVMSFEDGTRFVKVLTPEGLDRDSDCLRHCVGKGGYDELIEKGIADVYSLRDADDMAHATVEIRNYQAVQIKGYANKAVHEKFHEHVRAFLKKSGFSVRSDHENIGVVP